MDKKNAIATSYPNLEVAESVISEVLSKSKNVSKIEKWLKMSDEKLIISGNIGKEIGYGVRKDGSIVKLTKGGVVLVKTEGKIKILTSHPIE